MAMEFTLCTLAFLDHNAFSLSCRVISAFEIYQLNVEFTGFIFNRTSCEVYNRAQ